MNDLYLGENMDVNEVWTLYQNMLLKCIMGNSGIVIYFWNLTHTTD